MKNATESQTPAQIEAPAVSVETQVKAELDSQSNALSNFIKTSGAIGPLGLEQLARLVGESTSSAGRPQFGPYMALTFAVTASKVSFAAQDRLANIMNKAVTAVKKDGTRAIVAKRVAKASHGEASCSYRINKPVGWAIAVGE